MSSPSPSADEAFHDLTGGDVLARRKAASLLATMFGPPSNLPERARLFLNDPDKEVKVHLATAILRLASHQTEVRRCLTVFEARLETLKGQERSEAAARLVEAARAFDEPRRVLLAALPDLLTCLEATREKVRDAALCALAGAAEHGANVTPALRRLHHMLSWCTTASCRAARILKAAARAGTGPADEINLGKILALPCDCANDRCHGKSDDETARPEVERCLACESERTRCIYREAFGTNAGSCMITEFLCLDCGRYSTFNWDR